MTIAHLGSGNLFSVPYNLTAYQRAEKHGLTWGQVQLEVFAHSVAGRWLDSNNISYRFLEQPGLLDHGDVMIFIADDNEAMRFKLANVSI